MGVDEKLECERLKILLDSTSGALEDAKLAGLNNVEREQCLCRARRLKAEINFLMQRLNELRIKE